MKLNVQKIIKKCITQQSFSNFILILSLLFTTLSVAANDSQIEYGKPNKILDAMDWVTPQSLFGKALLWNKDIDSHHISAETVSIVRRYLDDNDMADVKIRVNQYHPKGEWKRLRGNKNIGAGWRYTLGALSVIDYTLIPNRIVGGDHYNPYTNTVHLFSDNFAIALHEAAHARAQIGHKGAFAASNNLPGAPLYHEANATKDVISYLENNGTEQQVAAAKKVLFPAYGTYLSTISDSLAAPVVGALIGHIVARRDTDQAHTTYNNTVLTTQK